VFQELNVAPEVVAIWEAVLRVQNYERRTHKVITVEKCGIVRECCYKGNPSLDYTRWNENTWNALAASTGLMQCIYRVFRLAEHRSTEALRELLEYVGKDLKILSGLPREVIAYLPFDSKREMSEQIEKWKSLEEAQLGGALIQKNPGLVRRYEVSSVDGASDADWKETIRKFPEFCLSVFGEEGWPGGRRGEEMYLEKSDGANRLAKTLLEKPVALLYFPEAWGKLFRLCPTLEEELRATLVKVAEKPVPTRSFVGMAHTFSLRLPIEAPLLPHILSVFNVFVDGPFARHWSINGDGRAGSTKPETFARLAGEFCENIEPLGEIIGDEGASNAVRAAAAMLLLLHPKAGENVREASRRELVTRYDAAIGWWYLRGVGVCLQGAIATDDARSCKVLGELLQAARNDYEGRTALDPVFESWRQASRAPVKGSGDSGLWR
jgi:hypothetical protein